jgi:mannose-6-phosphate isomerase-like protein (cupin superfamily)
MRPGLVFGLVLCAAQAAGQTERTVDPTFLVRHLPAVEAKTVDVSTDSCHYKPLFGEGDTQRAVVRGVVRFGEIAVAPGGTCNAVSYPDEEQAYVIMGGAGTLHYGEENVAVRKHDFTYLPVGVKHGVSSEAGVRLFVMGFRVPAGSTPPPKLMLANIDDIKKQTVGSHPDSVVYQLMMGDVNSKRDRIAAGHVLTSLYLMEFQPGGTNFPHHHDAEEEIYVLIDGAGDMVAGSGTDGVEARFAAKPGDAYFFRLNCTAGFYNGNRGLAHILAVRSLYPRRGGPR